MVTFPAGRFWSFCFWAAVLGAMTLNPEATSMLSLFCVVVGVLAQLINSAVHPAAILLRKRRVVDFIDVICRVTEFARVLQSRGKDEKSRWLYFFSCVPSWKAWPLLCIRSSVIRFSVFRAWVFNASLLLLTFPNMFFASCRLRSCHPAALQSIPRRAQCERKQLPNLCRRL